MVSVLESNTMDFRLKSTTNSLKALAQSFSLCALGKNTTGGVDSHN